MLPQQSQSRSSLRRAALLSPLLALACGKPADGVSLSKGEVMEIPKVPVPAADGPRLGAIAHTTPVREAPDREARLLGYLHAGASVARADKPYSTDDCPNGWYPIRPRGFVCLDEGATLDLRHPTLSAMAIQPSLDEPMPYTYARTKGEVDVFDVDPNKDRAVVSKGQMTGKSGAAIVGSWEAVSENGENKNLAMLTDGRFIDATKLQKAEYSSFQGVELNGKLELPVAFIVKRGISAWDISGPTIERKRELEFHEVLPLTGRFRTSHGEKFWETHEADWVRHKDVTTARKRSDMPAFVNETRRWVDVSIIAGTAVAYEGELPVYATLVSVGKDRLGEHLPDAEITQRGEFPVVSKHITALNAKPGGFANRVEMHDVPWVLELSSGQLMHAAYWHDRFGIEHGPGNLQLAPADARWLWFWLQPEVPAGWHALLDLPTAEQAAIINVRK